MVSFKEETHIVKIERHNLVLISMHSSKNSVQNNFYYYRFTEYYLFCCCKHINFITDIYSLSDAKVMFSKPWSSWWAVTTRITWLLLPHFRLWVHQETSTGIVHRGDSFLHPTQVRDTYPRWFVHLQITESPWSAQCTNFTPTRKRQLLRRDRTPAPIKHHIRNRLFGK